MRTTEPPKIHSADRSPSTGKDDFRIYATVTRRLASAMEATLATAMLEVWREIQLFRFAADFGTAELVAREIRQRE